MEKLELSNMADTKTLMSNLAISSKDEKAHPYGPEFYFQTQYPENHLTYAQGERYKDGH